MTSASEKIREYQYEIYRRKLATALYSTLVLLISVFLIMLFSGDRFNQYLAYFGIAGISNVAGGVYADCSLKENKNNAYCLKNSEKQDEEWKRLNRGGIAPFSLSN